MSTFIQTCRPIITTVLIVGSVLISGCSSTTEEAAIANETDTIPVTLKNYKIAESDLAFGGTIKQGAVNKLVHLPVQPLDLNNQTVVRMNQDTIYSAAVIDVSKGATITLPKTDGRYQAVMVVQNDHYINDVFIGAGTYEIKSDTDSDFVLLAVRTEINLNDPEDAKKVVALQQAIKLDVKGDKVFKQPNYNIDQLVKLRAELASEGLALGSLNNMQGARGTVDEHMHLLGTAAGWGLLPDANARYIGYVQEDGDGTGCYQANYKVPPFNDGGFFSITMYDGEGWMFSEKAILNKNNITFNEDGSFDANFGECGKDAKNNLSITKGWNFLMRVYEPKLDELDAYKLPTAVKKLDSKLSSKDLKEITKEAYIYTYPMMDNYKMIYVLKVWKDSPVYEAPFNELTHNAVLLGPEYTTMVRPNNDTFYSNAIFDLRAQPMILSVPAITDNRYYSWQLIDLFTHNVDYVGTRATGFEAGKYLIAGPNWSGTKPKGITKVIQTDSNILLALARTQVYSIDDAKNAKKIMNEYKVETLSKYIGAATPKAAATLDFPVYSLEKIRSLEFITYLNFALGLVKQNPSETALIKRFSKIGIGVNVPFDVNSIDPETKKIMQEAIDEAMVEIEAEVKNLGVVKDGWMQVSGAFGSPKAMEGKFLTRAAAAYFGLYGNDLEEAFYPDTTIDENGEALEGSKHNYVLHFSKDRLPPVKAFWSFSMYKLPEQLFTENSINRYVISSATEGLKYNKDGSLDIYIQKEKPSADKVSNWLPAYDGKFSLQARLYWPEPSSLEPLYVLPKVTISK